MIVETPRFDQSRKAGVYYERAINQIGRAIARIWPSAGVQDGGQR